MKDTISTIADLCGILGFLISLYAANGVYKLKKQQNNKVKVSNTSVGGNFTGRDSRSS
ncbi:hypothetical protein HK413_05240 [Mucilaginibacter sp. S1162]|uniref:Uncharacterized protein n=1 Tax=Mucilaginibacter humi TaxID=2732510 RepID=A0ABX1W0R0_9SPHI|nr:hypothetical protein [Mucilaginibacter humi]NNU33700.1 hypothetical protein [Mucilaginibacter humi]